MLAILAAAAAQTATPAPAPAGLQARFDAANTAALEGRCTEAVPLYDLVERAPGIARNALAKASIAVRKGGCLIAVDRREEGERLIRQGLPLLEARGAEFNTDVRTARLALASAARLRLDYLAAVGEAEKALTLSEGLFRVRPLQMLASLTLFDGDGRAIRYAEEAHSLLAADPEATKKELASVQTTYARALLNAGRHKEAYAVLKDSLAKQGGLKLKIGIEEVATRSDLAIAALLNRDQDRAREYLAYTGAGRIRDAPFNRATSMGPPACDAAIGLKPEDRAIVEFSLREDGRVGSVQPVYVTGDRRAALAFAKAVSNWSWTTEDAAKIPAFFRALTRIELRCTRGDEVPGISAPLHDAALAWLAVDAPAAWDEMSHAAALPLQRAAFAGAPSPRAQLAAAVALLDNPVLPGADKATIIERATALATAQGAPPALLGLLALERNGLSDSTKDWQAGARRLLADPALGGDPLVGATLRVLLATPYGRVRPKDAPALLDAVIAEPGLPERHPLKVHALLRRADLLAAGGDTAGAAAAVARTGLSAEQCASLGVTPALRSNGAGADDFPMAAQMLGFEGWVRTEFDIAADGRAVAPRVLIAYPPFVFDEAAVGVSSGARWTSSYRGQPVACAASSQQIKFLLPG